MNGQLACGVALGAVGAAAAVAGVHWVAVAAIAACIPFLTVGILLAVGTRDRSGRAPGPTR